MVYADVASSITSWVFFNPPLERTLTYVGNFQFEDLENVQRISIHIHQNVFVTIYLLMALRELFLIWKIPLSGTACSGSCMEMSVGPQSLVWVSWMCLLAPVDQRLHCFDPGREEGTSEHFLVIMSLSGSCTLFLGYQEEAVWVSLFPLEFVGTVSKERDPLGVLNFAICYGDWFSWRVRQGAVRCNLEWSMEWRTTSSWEAEASASLSQPLLPLKGWVAMFPPDARQEHKLLNVCPGKFPDIPRMVSCLHFTHLGRLLCPPAAFHLLTLKIHLPSLKITSR